MRIRACEVSVGEFVSRRLDVDKDFNRRLATFIREGATPLGLAQQPRAFLDRFVDRFEPQVINFVRTPTFASRVGLVSEIESSLPKVRF